MPGPWTIHDTQAFIATAMPPNTWTLKEAVPERTEFGPDTLALVYEGRFSPAYAGSPPLAAFPQGALPPGYDGGGNWRLLSAKPSRLYGPFWRVDVVAKGEISAKEAKIRWTSGANTFSAEDVTLPVIGPVAKVEGRVPEVGMERGYVVFAASPASPAVGTAAIPPHPRPTDPANPWGFIAADKAVYHYPSGWVREGVESDRIAPGLWWFTERYTYVFPVLGGG